MDRLRLWCAWGLAAGPQQPLVGLGVRFLLGLECLLDRLRGHNRRAGSDLHAGGFHCDQPAGYLSVDLGEISTRSFARETLRGI